MELADGGVFRVLGLIGGAASREISRVNLYTESS